MLYGRASGGGKFGEIDPDFHDPFAISASNKDVRDACISYLERKLSDADLVAKMTPPHPPFSARPVLVDRDYNVLDAIQRDNVSLITEGIARVTSTGIETTDGGRHDFDVIVYATGFHATKYLFPMTVTGRNGKTIEDLWDKDGPRAYVGCMMPGFPNLWALYGPNTNGGLLVPSIHELVTLYALQCLEHLILEDKQFVDVKEAAYWAYNRMVDERGAHKAYTDPRSNSYYWSEYGRSVTNCPFTASEMWSFVHHPHFDELDIR